MYSVNLMISCKNCGDLTFGRYVSMKTNLLTLSRNNNFDALHLLFDAFQTGEQITTKVNFILIGMGFGMILYRWSGKGVQGERNVRIVVKSSQEKNKL